MSLICLCVVDGIKNSDLAFYTQRLELLAKHHKRGIKFFVDWPEPLLSCIQKNSLIINILDRPESDNCELFLLPDGWYSNGRTDKLGFRERMKFLQDISSVFSSREYRIELYLGESGTLPEDYFDITLKRTDLADYLTATVGIFGLNDGVHISIINTEADLA